MATFTCMGLVTCRYSMSVPYATTTIILCASSYSLCTGASFASRSTRNFPDCYDHRGNFLMRAWVEVKLFPLSPAGAKGDSAVQRTLGCWLCIFQTQSWSHRCCQLGAVNSALRKCCHNRQQGMTLLIVSSDVLCGSMLKPLRRGLCAVLWLW